VPGGAAQEKASFALLGATTVAIADGDPSEAWFVIHEVAHQWFGRALGPDDWAENWLNEGFAVLATRAFSAHAWGEARGEAEVERARTRYGRLVEQGRDRPLRVPRWTTPGDAGGAVAYTKSLLLLERLRSAVGAEVFDQAIRAWFASSSRPVGATSESLIEALDEASMAAELDGVLLEWVDGVGEAARLIGGD